MKILFKIFLVMFLVAPLAHADEVSLLVLPDATFPDASEIISKDVTSYFNKSGKIKAQTFNPPIKYRAQKPDFIAYNKAAAQAGSNFVLVISSYVVPEGGKRDIARGFWETNRVAEAFELQQPFELETRAVLIDNDIIIWSKTYRKKVTNKQNMLPPEATQVLKLYSKDVLSQDIVQNITLRFFPKSIHPIDVPNTAGDGPPVLRFDPVPTTRPPLTPSDGDGEMMYSM